jgi:hypothetical protein
MIGAKTAQVFVEHPPTAGNDPQMMDSRSRLEINRMTRVAPPVRKFSFKIICDPHESLVKTANLEGDAEKFPAINSSIQVGPQHAK